MKITIDQMTVKSKKVLGYLASYLEKVKDYEHFNPFDKIRVFVTDDGDFTAFEALDYNLQFTSSAHKLTETIQSSCIIDPIPFDRLYIRVEQLARESNL